MLLFGLFTLPNPLHPICDQMPFTLTHEFQ